MAIVIVKSIRISRDEESKFFQEYDSSSLNPKAVSALSFKVRLSPNLLLTPIEFKNHPARTLALPSTIRDTHSTTSTPSFITT